MRTLRSGAVLVAFAGLVALGCDQYQTPVEPPTVGGAKAAKIVVSGAGVEPNDACSAATNLGLVTPLPLTIWDTLSGSPYPHGDVDFFSFAATPNAPVIVDLEGQVTGQGTLADPVLGAFDSGCNRIAVNDDGGVPPNSRLALLIPADGILILAVTAYPDTEFNQGGTGSYRLTVQDSAPPPTGPPVAAFGFYPYDPSTFDVVQFYDFSYDPAGAGIASRTWNLGDGTTATGDGPTHRYAADGVYTVRLAVTTFDGRTDSTSQTLSVRTHDVAITKFSVSRSASAGQTRTLTVGVNSRRAPETVEVTLMKGVPGGYEYVGSLIQSVPVRSANRTTDFNFSYTFTSADAQVGKVTFKAVANIFGARDALPADNEAIATPIKVSR
jgi:PKD repeat protein